MRSPPGGFHQLLPFLFLPPPQTAVPIVEEAVPFFPASPGHKSFSPEFFLGSAILRQLDRISFDFYNVIKTVSIPFPPSHMRISDRLSPVDYRRLFTGKT